MTDKPAATGKAYTEQPTDWPGVVASFRDAPQYVHTGVFITVVLIVAIVAFKARDIGAGIGAAFGKSASEKPAQKDDEALRIQLENLKDRVEQHAADQKEATRAIMEDLKWFRDELSEIQDRYASKDEFRSLTRLTEHLIEEVTRTVAVIRERALSE